MIYTVTFNPAIDYVVHTPDFKMGMVNRSQSEKLFFGGKGINVSVVLNQLGVPSKALGFVAGFVGDAIEQGIKAQGIDADFIHLNGGQSRINVKIKGDCETELNAEGPEIDEYALGRLLDKLDALSCGDILVLSGSVPKSVAQNIYEIILQRLKNRGIRAVVDAENELLISALRHKPYLIKPNLQELRQIFSQKITDKRQIEECALRLQKMGAENVLVSLAEDGALLAASDGQIYRHSAYSGVVKNTVGAGDSMIAGFLAGIENGDMQYALRLGIAAGSATAFSDGLAKKDEILKLLSQ